MSKMHNLESSLIAATSRRFVPTNEKPGMKKPNPQPIMTSEHSKLNREVQKPTTTSNPYTVIQKETDLEQQQISDSVSVAQASPSVNTQGADKQDPVTQTTGHPMDDVGSINPSQHATAIPTQQHDTPAAGNPSVEATVEKAETDLPITHPTIASAEAVSKGDH